MGKFFLNQFRSYSQGWPNFAGTSLRPCLNRLWESWVRRPGIRDLNHLVSRSTCARYHRWQSFACSRDKTQCLWFCMAKSEAITWRRKLSEWSSRASWCKHSTPWSNPISTFTPSQLKRANRGSILTTKSIVLLSKAILMWKIRGMFGSVTCPSWTLVVTSHTKIFAWDWADAMKSNRPSLLMQKAEISGLTASKRLFSGLRNCCLIFGTLPSGFYCEAAGSWFSSMKTMRLEAE